MKSQNRNYWKLAALALGVAGVSTGLCPRNGLAAPNVAGSPAALPAYYEGEVIQGRERFDTKLWIRQVEQQDGTKSTYGILVGKSLPPARDSQYGRHDGRGAQLFRIDDLGGGKQLWMQLFQDSNGLLQFGQDATYDGTVYWKGSKVQLKLSVTEYGAQIGCEGTLELESESGPRWSDFPALTHEIDGPHDSEGTISHRAFNGKVVIGGEVYAGSYTLQKIFPGIAIMNLVSVSQDSIDGKMVSKKITAVVAIFFHPRGFLGRNTYEYEFIRLDPGKEECFPESVILEN